MTIGVIGEFDRKGGGSYHQSSIKLKKLFINFCLVFYFIEKI